MPQKKKLTNFQTELLVNLLAVATCVVLILIGRRTWAGFGGMIICVCIRLAPKFFRRNKEKCLPYAILYWEDGRQEKVIEFLVRKSEDKAAMRGSLVTMKCYIYKIDKDGTIDTGCDVYIKTADLHDDPWTAMTLKTLHAGDFITVTGHIGEVFAGFMNIEKIEAIEKTAPVLVEGGECDG